jgi:hypothetical protein
MASAAVVLISTVNAALASLDATTIGNLQSELDTYNNNEANTPLCH